MPKTKPTNHDTSPQLPAHIRQLVDKKNYVIAIKTYAQEQNIGLEDAKNAIDAYEESQKNPPIQQTTNQNLQQLQASLDNHLATQGIKTPRIPYWLKRVLLICLIMGIFGGLLYQKLG